MESKVRPTYILGLLRVSSDFRPLNIYSVWVHLHRKPSNWERDSLFCLPCTFHFGPTAVWPTLITSTFRRRSLHISASFSPWGRELSHRYSQAFNGPVCFSFLCKLFNLCDSKQPLITEQAVSYRWRHPSVCLLASTARAIIGMLNYKFVFGVADHDTAAFLG